MNTIQLITLKAVDKSLNSLKVNIINTLYLHNWHKSFNFEGSGILELIEKLKREGKLLKFGISFLIITILVVPKTFRCR